MTEGWEKEISTADMVRFIRRQDLLHVVSMAGRPGALALLTSIEWYWFTPDTPKNADFYLMKSRWKDLDWVVASFDRAKLGAVRNLANRLGMRLADGAPGVITGPAVNAVVSSRVKTEHEIEFFPGASMEDGSDNKALWTVENSVGSPVHRNCRRTDAEIRACELEVMAAFQRGMTLRPAQVADYLYGSGGFPHQK